MDYVCYYATKIITTQLCNELACGGPGLPRNCIAQHNYSVLGKTIAQTLGKTTVTK